LVRTGFKTHFGSDWLQNSWICVFAEKGSRRASARLRALFTSSLAHELFAQSRLKSSFETSSRKDLLLKLLSNVTESMGRKRPAVIRAQWTCGEDSIGHFSLGNPILSVPYKAHYFRMLIVRWEVTVP